ncbi:MAG: response regulator [Spirochaetaceae bacterium]|jgi:putative two-component system response regulator|nr:response regulator [Spirochaetaceae bacterium]
MNKERPLIAMVDDDSSILRAGKTVLSEKYSVATLSSAKKLFAFLENNTPALILLDVMMPEMDGYQTIKILKSNETTRAIPVIFLTGKSGSEGELEGLNLGAIDYITKPFFPPLLLKRIDVHLLVERQKKILELQWAQLNDFNDNLRRMVEEKTHTVTILQNAIIKTVADLVEYWDDITGGHNDRTRQGVYILLNALKNDPRYEEELAIKDVELLLQSSLLHDVGKIAIDDRILRKRGPLNRTEFEEMKKHTIYGGQVIERIKIAAAENDFLNYAKIFAETHHERWDGTGYPNGLRGENIPLLGRIMAFADVYDALVSERSYKKSFSHNDAVSIILKGRGAQFDPALTDIFEQVAGQFQMADHTL